MTLRMTPKKELAQKDSERSPVRMAAEDRRQQILDVAVRLFSQKGFRGTTTKEIALAAGVNEAIIFRHFATKSELYAAIIDSKGEQGCMHEMQAQIAQAIAAKDDKKVFETFALSVLDFHQHDETPMRIWFYSVLEGNELSKMIFRNHMATMHRVLADYLKQRMRAGAFRKVEPNTAVRAFNGMVMGHAIHERFFADEAHELLNINNRQAAERFTDIFLAGIKANTV
ncbi:MAG: TetR/AcrR family transcriptional regulator [Acidobacteria bacterium]|nr:TetR/AcrR family transcriptional regulator [Acidobacteriota bacterium]